MIDMPELEKELVILKKNRLKNIDIQDSINLELDLDTRCYDDFSGIYMLSLGRKNMIKLLLAIKRLKQKMKGKK